MTDAYQETARRAEQSEITSVVVRGNAAGFAQEILAGPHRMSADESVSAGGADTGQRLTISCSPPWAPVLRLLWGCTPGGKNGRSLRSLSICDIRRYTPSIVQSARRKKECWIELNGTFTLRDH
jgi:hypothetical protein